LQSFPESFSINNLAGQKLNANFVAIKIGDVNGSATLGVQTPELRSAGEPLWIELEDQVLQTGQEQRVVFRVKDLAAIQGYQMALQYDLSALELRDIHYGLAKAENFGVFRENGLITTNWYTDQVLEHPDAELFTLIFRVKKSKVLSQVLRLNPEHLHPEAYNFADERLLLHLRFNEKTVQTPSFELYQNVPNPFAETTTIRFYLPEALEGQVQIFDAAGRLLKTIKGNFVSGLNQVELQAADLPSGVLYYSFRSGKYAATRKMVRQE
jgi:hypothetical protein